MQIASSEVAPTLRRLILETFLFGGGDAALDEHESLVGTGVLDSTGVLELVMLLEETFKIVVDDADVVPENLDSLAALTAFVRRKWPCS